MAKLITVNSYFGLFCALREQLSSKMTGMDGKNLVFCEEKVSLMAERNLCAEAGGSFNTEVYSFGNFLRVKKPMDNLLSKEGSAMVVKKILNSISLNRFNRSKAGLAPSLYDLIIQLKSASVTPEDLSYACEKVTGILKDKISDVYRVFVEYEKYLKEHGLFDQSSALTFLPEIIESDIEMQNTDVFIVGFSGFTAQVRSAISSLLKKCRSVTAILTAGDNTFAFVNETREHFLKICKQQNIPCEQTVFESDYSLTGKIIADGLFNPTSERRERVVTDNVFALSAGNVRAETERVGNIIKDGVMQNRIRYRDVTIIIPEKDVYRNSVTDIFDELDIPYFFDEKKKPQNHPLITLITAYVDLFRKGYSRETLGNFYKNPLFCGDKDFTDKFENYLLKYNIEYGRIKTAFTLPAKSEEELSEFEKFRISVCDAIKTFDVEELLNALSVKDKLLEMSEILRLNGRAEESAVNDQMYDCVLAILTQMKNILGDFGANYTEFKEVFLSGVSALELSIIPQYNDAVFIGGFKEAGLSQAKYLFCMGLTSAVPAVKEDVALLTDGDISALSEIKVLVEPKIQIINHRSREETALGLSAFSEKLYISYPIAKGGEKTVKSEICNFCERRFTLRAFDPIKLYLTEKQGLKNFSKACGDYSVGRIDDFTLPTSFYRATINRRAEKIAEYANKEIKERLENNSRVLIKDVTSPTAIEEFYKCPYRFFVGRCLNVKPRETGEIDGLTVGNLMHEIFKEYVENIGAVSDENSSDTLFDRIAEGILSRKEYEKFLYEPDLKYSMTSALNECKKFCFKTYAHLTNSNFTAEKTNLEVGFGDKVGCRYPSIKLLDGKVKLSGKIDRVDTYKDYCRVIDYKTGSVDKSEKMLFAGIKLQLWLYGLAVNDKRLAGAYYLPVSDPYKKDGEKPSPLVVGKTLNTAELDLEKEKGYLSDEQPIEERSMQALLEYARKISENAVREMDGGLILPSPYEKECEHCEFSSLCGGEGRVRKVKSVDVETIENAVGDLLGGDL